MSCEAKARFVFGNPVTVDRGISCTLNAPVAHACPRLRPLQHPLLFAKKNQQDRFHLET